MKASFWSLKEYEIFYTKFHSAKQNELYTLIQAIHLHPYPINIVSGSLYSVFILGNIGTYYKFQTTYYSTTFSQTTVSY